ncbi:MAG: Na+/H+ antiporter NhaA [Hyphomicrobiales bacterium]
MKSSIHRKPLLNKITDPLQSFVRLESFGGIILIIASIAALIVANSAFGPSFISFWDKYAGLKFENLKFDLSVLHWINDGLMAIFFFVVGLEIKREILTGGLSSFKKASLPIFAAVGGMIVPALLYFSLNKGDIGSHAWGIPMATDIAFALGVLTLLGKRIPTSLKLFLTSLAIIDDIGAVIVIAVFYTSSINTMALIFGGIIFVILLMLNFLSIRTKGIYLVLGVILWYAFLKSGVHATIAGILLAFTIPSRANRSLKEFVECNIKIIHKIREHKESRQAGIEQKFIQSAIYTVEKNCEDVLSPLQWLEHKLHPYVVYIIVPLFAFSNAGIFIDNTLISELSSSISLGIFVGLFIGKPVGIYLFSRISVALKIADKPVDIRWKQIVGLGFLAGIGFTMSFFVSQLAFSSGEELNIAKLAVLISSLISGVTGYLLLRFSKTKA